MAHFGGRALRIKISLDGGATFTAITGATSDNFTINREGINVTDKDDVGVQTFIDDEVGSWAMEGGFEGYITDDDILQFANSTTQFTYDAQVAVGGLGTYAGKIGLTSYGVTGAEGAEAATFSGSIVSSGTMTFTAA